MRKIIEPIIPKEKFAVEDNTRTVNAYCPIDGTQLVSVIEYDFSNYSCVACGARYKWGDENPDSLREQAIRYVSEVKCQAEVQSKKLARLEQIIQVAQQNGIL